MSRWSVTLSATGTATVEVEADTREQAIDEAYRRVPGLIVEGGSTEWEVEYVTEEDA